MQSTVPLEASAMPAFALLELEPDRTGDGSNTDAESCPKSAPGLGLGVVSVATVCVTGENVNAAASADYSKYPW